MDLVPLSTPNVAVWAMTAITQTSSSGALAPPISFIFHFLTMTTEGIVPILKKKTEAWRGYTFLPGSCVWCGGYRDTKGILGFKIQVPNPLTTLAGTKQSPVFFPCRQGAVLPMPRAAVSQGFLQ